MPITILINFNKLIGEKLNKRYGKSAIQCSAPIRIKIITAKIVNIVTLFLTAKWINAPQKQALINKVIIVLLNLIAAAADMILTKF